MDTDESSRKGFDEETRSSGDATKRDRHTVRIRKLGREHACRGRSRSRRE